MSSLVARARNQAGADRILHSMLPARPTQKRNSELSAALARCRHALIGIGVFTAAINLLQLTGPFFMLEVYDRVLPEPQRARPWSASVLALVLFAFQGLLESLRGRVLVRIAASLDEALSRRGLRPRHASCRSRRITPAPAFQPLRDLDQIRSFLSTVGPGGLLRPALDAALSRHLLPVPSADRLAGHGRRRDPDRASRSLTECLTRQPPREAAAGTAGGRNGLAEASRRNAEVVQAMGMAAASAPAGHEHNRRLHRRPAARRRHRRRHRRPSPRSCAWCCSRRVLGSAPSW